ncbi:transcription factor Jun-like [Styela clava]|uniref:transcription factor AP-1-like n=1 Tax=Styela clava TaxID=7725 RepID=UPI001939508A|nr:transcription factor AP-1-like [Styela clava]
MEVASFYHEDNLVNYDQQSSPSSVGSAGSTDIGVVSAICPPYGGVEFNKDVVLKNMNLNLDGPHTQLKQHLKPIENTVIASHSSVVQQNNTHHQNGNTHHRLNNGSVINGQAAQHHGVITNAYGTLGSAYTLASPDVNMLKLGSPDLERLMGHNPHIHNNGQYMQQKQHITSGVTQEQEMYAQGFERELERLKSRSGSNPDIPASGIQSAASIGAESSPCSVITTGASQQQMVRQLQPYVSEQYYQHPSATSGMAINQVLGGTIHHMSNPALAHLKEEPSQIVPVMSNTPPMSPIDLVNQEVMKSERKRQRNRVAASKCRKRKLERISRLEDKVKSLKTQNMELSTNANILRQQVADLKSKVMAHVNSGCQLMMSQQQVNF